MQIAYRQSDLRYETQKPPKESKMEIWNRIKVAE